MVCYEHPAMGFQADEWILRFYNTSATESTSE